MCVLVCANVCLYVCIRVHMHHNNLLSAPSAGPENIVSYDVVPRSFSVQWGLVPCIHRNGDITGYSVKYGEIGSDIRNIDNAERFTTNFSGVMPDTKYSVEVAGVNSNGVGVYQSIRVITPQSQL